MSALCMQYSKIDSTS
jgi:nucleolar complex protein 2